MPCYTLLTARMLNITMMMTMQVFKVTNRPTDRVLKCRSSSVAKLIWSLVVVDPVGADGTSCLRLRLLFLLLVPGNGWTLGGVWIRLMVGWLVGLRVEVARSLITGAPPPLTLLL